jgi:hypothetical protein
MEFIESWGRRQEGKEKTKPSTWILHSFRMLGAHLSASWTRTKDFFWALCVPHFLFLVCWAQTEKYQRHGNAILITCLMEFQIQVFFSNFLLYDLL